MEHLSAAALVFLAWCALSVPLGIFIGRIIALGNPSPEYVPVRVEESVRRARD